MYNMKDLRRVFESKANKYLLVSLVITFLCPLLVFSYSNFIEISDSYTASQMFIGNISYSMRIDDEPTSSVVVEANSEKEVKVSISALNDISSKYKLIYEEIPNVTIEYASDDNEPTQGAITTTRDFSLLITNNSDNDVTIEFGVASGYSTNEVEDIDVPTGYDEIPETYMKYDMEVLSLYIDNERVEELDSNVNYNFIRSECTNNETVTWDNETRNITVGPLTQATKCSLYFETIVIPDYPTLVQKIQLDNIAHSDEGVNFNNAPGATNGEGLMYTSDLSKTEDINGDGTGEVVYYYRGAVTNNYLYFAGYCWRIIRINEDGSVRLRYGGKMTGTSCPQTGTVVNAGSGYYNTATTDNMYIGFMYGSSTTSTSVTTAQTNSFPSSIKTLLERWYTGTNGSNIYGISCNNCDYTTLTTKLVDYADKLADSIFCNDRSISSASKIADKTNSMLAYGNNITYYGGAERFLSTSSISSLKSNISPQFKCAQNNDKFTLRVSNGGTSGYGNNVLTYPVGLITADELIYAGYINYNNSNYLYTGGTYWTMTPIGHHSYYATMYVAGVVSSNATITTAIGTVKSSYGIVPVLSLKSDVLVSGGTGAYNDPYVIE